MRNINIVEIEVICPYIKDCPVKERQKLVACRTERCILKENYKDCKLIMEGMPNEK